MRVTPATEHDLQPGYPLSWCGDPPSPAEKEYIVSWPGRDHFRRVWALSPQEAAWHVVACCHLDVGSAVVVRVAGAVGAEWTWQVPPYCWQCAAHDPGTPFVPLPLPGEGWRLHCPPCAAAHRTYGFLMDPLFVVAANIYDGGGGLAEATAYWGHFYPLTPDVRAALQQHLVLLATVDTSAFESQYGQRPTGMYRGYWTFQVGRQSKTAHRTGYWPGVRAALLRVALGQPVRLVSFNVQRDWS